MSYYDNQLHSKNVYSTNSYHSESSTILASRVLLFAVLSFAALYSIELSLLVLALFFNYLYLESFIWLTIKIEVLFSGLNACLLSFSSFCFYLILLLLYSTSTYSISIYSTQYRYSIALFILRNIYDAILDPSIFICLSKSQSNQISHLTISSLWVIRNFTIVVIKVFE